MESTNMGFFKAIGKFKSSLLSALLILLMSNGYGLILPPDTIDLRIKPKQDTIAEYVLFTAVINGEICYLKWTVKGQANDGVYCIERSNDGKHFEIIGIKEGIGTLIKQSLLYCFQDDSLRDAVLYYRIRHISERNTLLVSDVIKVTHSVTCKQIEEIAKNKGY